MTAAKMDEAYGYRSNPVPDGSNTMTVTGAQTTGDIRRINSLEKTVQSLCSKLYSLISVHNIVNQVLGIFMLIGRAHALHAKGEDT